MGAARRRMVATAIGVVGLLLMSGCMSTHPGSSSLAYVDIEGHGAAAVRAETIRVFTDDNYQLTGESDGTLAFEREGTQRDHVLFGHYGDKSLNMRVVVSIAPRRQGGCLVRADADVLRDGDVDRVPRIARRPYQDLLNRVQTSLVTAAVVK